MKYEDAAYSKVTNCKKKVFQVFIRINGQDLESVNSKVF